MLLLCLGIKLETCGYTFHCYSILTTHNGTQMKCLCCLSVYSLEGNLFFIENCYQHVCDKHLAATMVCMKQYSWETYIITRIFYLSFLMHLHASSKYATNSMARQPPFLPICLNVVRQMSEDNIQVFLNVIQKNSLK